MILVSIWLAEGTVFYRIVKVLCVFVNEAEFFVDGNRCGLGGDRVRLHCTAWTSFKLGLEKVLTDLVD